MTKPFILNPKMIEYSENLLKQVDEMIASVNEIHAGFTHHNKGYLRILPDYNRTVAAMKALIPDLLYRLDTYHAWYTKEAAADSVQLYFREHPEVEEAFRQCMHRYKELLPELIRANNMLWILPNRLEGEEVK